MPLRLKWAILLLIGCPTIALAQLQILHPMPRLVVQRGSNGTGRLHMSERFASAVNQVEATLTSVSLGQGTATD